MRGFSHLLLAAVTLALGCSRSTYRIAADQEVYGAIAERNNDPRWMAPKYDVEIDPRSRYFDPYDPDRPPIPVDDPSSAVYMRCVDGKRGWKHWYDDGIRDELENPDWQSQLGDYVEFDQDGAIQLDIDSSLQLAYIHSPNQQSQLETLYLSSIDVTRERFNLQTQVFGGYDIGYDHQGNIEPARIAFNPLLGQYEILPPTRRPESNVLAIGSDGVRRTVQVNRRFATAGTLLAGFANSFVFEFTGPNQGLTASLLNFAFLQPLLRGAGRDIALEGLTQTERDLLANLRSYAQFRQGFYTQVAVGELGVVGPQRGGRGTALDVFSGQAVLGGYVGLLRQLQVIRNAEDNLDLQIRTRAQLEALLTAGLIDLVQVDQFRQNVKSDQASLLQLRIDYLRSLDQFKLFTLGLPPSLDISLNDELIRQFQLVDRNATEIQNKIAALLERPKAISENPTAEAIEKLRSDTFDLITPLSENLSAVATDLQNTKQIIPVRLEPMTDDEQTTLLNDFDLLDRGYEELVVLLREIEQEAELIRSDLPALDSADNDLERPIDDERDSEEQADPPTTDDVEPTLNQDGQTLENEQPSENDERLGKEQEGKEQEGKELEGKEQEGEEQEGEEQESDTQEIGDDASPANEREQPVGDETPPPMEETELVAPERTEPLTDEDKKTQGQIDRMVVLLRKMLRLVQGSILVQARARLEAVTIEEINLSPEEAFQIALQNRLDFMNGRAALVDSWRQIQIASDALQSVLDLSASGTIETDRNNPLSLRGSTTRTGVGVQFDAPFTRLLERNDYRESLINYQRNRRNFIQSRDRLQLDLRNLLRDIEQLRSNLEIQRSAVGIAIRRVDVTGTELYAPVPPPQPGQRSAPFGPTAAINLLSAQSALRDTQNSFLTAWLNYYAAKLRLSRELGVMQLDQEGRLIQSGLPSGSIAPLQPPQNPQPEQLEELPPPIDSRIMDAVEEIDQGLNGTGMIDAETIDAETIGEGMIDAGRE
ncbi:MAG: TolC family protein [Planctomycetota bacterium]